MQNLHGLVVKYHGATNTRGSRVSITSPRFGNQRVYIPYDYAKNHSEDMAEEWLVEHGFEIIGQAESGHGSSVLLSTTFKALKQ